MSDGSVATEGRPATKPPDENTDVVFPGAAGRYDLVLPGDSQLEARHLTIGRGAIIGPRRTQITGNVWVGRGGMLRGHTHRVVGDKHTFARYDKGTPPIIGNNVGINKHDGGSVEWLGAWDLDDQLHVYSGTMIVGPGSSFTPGDRGQHNVFPDGKLVLMSGAVFQSRANKHFGHDIVVSGQLLAGTPERPLTKDCVFGLSFRNHERAEEPQPLRLHGFGGLVLNPGARLAVHSADPTKARLVFRHHGGKPASGYGEGTAKLPRRICMVLLGKLDLNGVEFNDIHRGGIRLPDPDVRKQWKNVFFGENNAGEAEELFAPHTGPESYGLGR